MCVVKENRKTFTSSTDAHSLTLAVTKIVACSNRSLSTARATMTSSILLMGLLLTVSADTLNTLQKSTEDPGHIVEEPSIPKEQKPPLHISEFTDPHTGLNPFLDLEEGLASRGRNAVKNERKVDSPVFDYELVEGDSNDRGWKSKFPSDAQRETGHQRSSDDGNVWKDISSTLDIVYTTEGPKTDENPTTEGRRETSKGENGVRKQIETSPGTSSTGSRNSTIYMVLTVGGTVTLAMLITICWWRQRAKRSLTTNDEESGKLNQG